MPRGEPCYESIPKAKAPRNPFLLLVHLDIIILLALTAIVCAVYYGFTATISALYVTAYPFLSETEIGLCFLAVGGGMIIGSTCNGKILDWEYRKFAKMAAKAKNPAENGPELKDIVAKQTIAGDFPIEKARLRLLPILIIILVACCAGYGWCVEKQVNLAGPLVLQFIGTTTPS
ncbi:hypothetical protein DXG01_011927 [Tephrocybe rancida]|nr:hypothetical protein DXG01_011927 [Tephrocybe rancida]